MYLVTDFNGVKPEQAVQAVQRKLQKDGRVIPSRLLEDCKRQMGYEGSEFLVLRSVEATLRAYWGDNVDNINNPEYNNFQTIACNSPRIKIRQPTVVPNTTKPQTLYQRITNVIKPNACNLAH